MAKSSSVTVKILGDAKGLQKELDESSGALGRFGSGVGTIAKGAGLALGGMGLAAIAAAPAILSAGSELDALAKKSAVVFEDSLGTMQAWAKENAASMGLTADAAVGVGAGIADLLKPMGFSAEAAASMTQEMLDASGALSAWSGGTKSATEVSEIITKAMLGETDGLKALGISISAADVQAQLALKGQQNLTGAALEQAEAIAIQELIMAKSTDAQKAWGDGTMDGVKAQNEAKASMDKLKETVVKALYPALQSLMPVITTAAQWLGERLPGAIAWLKGVTSDLVARFKEWWPGIQSVIQSVVNWLTTVAWPAIQVVWIGIETGISALVGYFKEHWGTISATVEQAMGYISGIIETVTTIITALWDRFGSSLITYVQTAWNTISGVVTAAINIVRGVINVVMGLIRGDFSLAWDGIKGVVSGVWTGITTLISTAIETIKLAMKVAWEVIKGAAFIGWEAIKAVVMTPINAMGTLLSAAWDGIKSAASTAWEAVKTAIQPIINAIKAVVDGLIGAIERAIDMYNRLKNAALGGVNFKPTIVGSSSGTPKYHSGGITNFGAAGEGLALLRNNEAIIPLDNPSDARRVMNQAGLGVGGGGSWTIINNGITDHQALAVRSSEEIAWLMKTQAA